MTTATTTSSRWSSRRPPRRRGLGLIELLISLSITAALLTAVAVATVASSKVINETEDFSRAAQTARTTLNLILTDCRRGQPDATGITSTEFRVLTAENVDRTFRYDAANERIVMIDNDVVGDTGRVVARHVTSATFYADSSGMPLATKRLTLDLTVSVGRNSIHLSGSASPRQNATY